MTFEERDDRRTNALGLMEDGRKEGRMEGRKRGALDKKAVEGGRGGSEKKFGSKASLTLPIG